MRTRDEITEELYQGNNGEEYYQRAVMIEVLLDIRDLLGEMVQSKPAP